VAEHLADCLELRLVLAHVIEQPPGFPLLDSEHERKSHGPGRYLLREVAATMELHPRTQLRTEIGDPATMLAMLAKEERAELVVAGSRGRGKIRAALLGSLTANLVKQLSCPLLVVPRGGAGAYAAALTASDASVVCGIAGGPDERVVGHADHMAGRLAAQLHVVQAGTTIPTTNPLGVMGAPLQVRDALIRQERERQRLLDRAAGQIQEAPRTELSFDIGDPAQTLAHIASESATALLVVADDSPWQRLAAAANIPVAVVPVAADSSAEGRRD
jgi:nucleotide-binding universal stress UspA family protein